MKTNQRILTILFALLLFSVSEIYAQKTDDLYPKLYRGLDKTTKLWAYGNYNVIYADEEYNYDTHIIEGRDTFNFVFESSVNLYTGLYVGYNSE